MKKNLSALLFAASAFAVMQSATPVYAVSASLTDTLSINGGEFVINEYNYINGAGYYDVHNNSTNGWYIIAFAVSNPNGLTDNPQTTFSNWNAYGVSLQLGPGGSPSIPTNAYGTGDLAGPIDGDNLHLDPLKFDLSHYIAPGTSSSEFTYSAVGASIAGLLVVNAEQVEGQFSTVENTPLPAALPLFAGGLGVIGLLARRRKRKAQAALAAA